MIACAGHLLQATGLSTLSVAPCSRRNYSPATANRPTRGNSSIGRSGRIQKVKTMANNNKQTETANGNVQLPVRSRIQAKATGERMPATAPAAFISELEVPA